MVAERELLSGLAATT
jgi:hypothetical protein